MLGVLLILILSMYVLFFYPIIKPKANPAEDKDSRYAKQMKKLWSVAQDSMRQRKPLRAEKALLTILKFDEKNAAAYNRLGILYAKEQKYDEAIECFEIAQSLDNNASSLHNAGLIYLETGAYEKAAIAFEQAIKLEGDVPARFIALAKSYEQLGKRKDALENLESAYSLSPTLTTLRQILALHEAADDAEAVAATNARIEAQMAANAEARKARQKSVTRSRLGRRISRPTIKASSRRRTTAGNSRTTVTARTKSATRATTTSHVASSKVTRATTRAVATRTGNSLHRARSVSSTSNVSSPRASAGRTTRSTKKSTRRLVQ